jgi:gag-polypeptide of LTR copia-type
MATIVLGMSAAEQEHVIDCQSPKAAWDILEKLYGGKGRNRKFMLLQELFRMSMGNSMDGYLRVIKEKMSELSAIGMKLERDIKLAIVLNGLTESYQYLVVAMESQLETIDFDDLTARLLEEEQKLVGGNGSDGTGSAMVLYTKDTDVTSVWKDGRLQMACYYCGQGGPMKRDCDIRKFRMRVAEEREKEKRQKAERAGMAIAQDGENEGSNLVTIW